MTPENRFTRCLLEQKDEESRQARRLRRRTVLIAILIQVVAIGLLMLRPLFGASAEKLMIARFVPGVPWKGSRDPGKAETHRPPAGHHTTPGIHLWRPPTMPDRVPDHVYMHPEQAPDVQSGGDSSGPLGFGDPDGLVPSAGLFGNDRPAPPPPPRDSEPRHTTRIDTPSSIQEAKLIVRIEPVYPAIAKQARLEGVVVLRAVIARDGSMQSLEVLSGNPLFIRSALDAITRWHYHPTLLNGEPVEVETLITVTYKLH